MVYLEGDLGHLKLSEERGDMETCCVNHREVSNAKEFGGDDLRNEKFKPASMVVTMSTYIIDRLA